MGSLPLTILLGRPPLSSRVEPSSHPNQNSPLIQSRTPSFKASPLIQIRPPSSSLLLTILQGRPPSFKTSLFQDLPLSNLPLSVQSRPPSVKPSSFKILSKFPSGPKPAERCPGFSTRA